MNKADYLHKKLAIESKSEADLGDLARVYVLSHNDVKIGDFFTDPIGTIKVEKIKVSIASLCCIYYGAEYTKKMKPRQDCSKRDAWQSNKVN